MGQHRSGERREKDGNVIRQALNAEAETIVTYDENAITTIWARIGRKKEKRGRHARNNKAL